MATNFKNKSVSVGQYVKYCLGCFWNYFLVYVLGALILAALAAVCTIAVVLSPIWFPIFAIKDPEQCALELNTSPKRGKGLMYVCIRGIGLATVRVIGWLNKPVIASLPMKYRKEFILQGSKPLYDYPVKTQVAYYKSFCDGGKRNLINGSLSNEARATIWQDITERDNYVLSGKELTHGQIVDLLKAGSDNTLWLYFKNNTPNKDMLFELVRFASDGNSAAQNILVQLVRQQRPSKDLIARIHGTGQTRFIERVNEILDHYADMDAVNFSISEVYGELSDEEKQKIVDERWANFCKVKKSISLSAQKKMNHAQFKAFIASGHLLEYYALLHLLLNINNEEYLKEVISTELEHIQDNRILSALKADYWRYSCYLAVVSEQSAA